MRYTVIVGMKPRNLLVDPMTFFRHVEVEARWPNEAQLLAAQIVAATHHEAGWMVVSTWLDLSDDKNFTPPGAEPPAGYRG